MVKKELKLIHSYKLNERKLKIILHAPLHPSYWIYLMETMPEHDWFIEPNENFEESGTPKNNVKYTIVPRKSNIKYDVQVICLSSHAHLYKKLLQDFHIPVVFLDFHKWHLPKLKVKYPLISACRHTSNKNYSNIVYNYVPPSKTLWSTEWKGDIRRVFIPAQRYLEAPYSHTYFSKLIPKLQKTDLNLNIVRNRLRTIPWKEWQSNYIHDSVLLDCADKTSSFVLEEAMTIGMPVISRNKFETPFMLRDKVDGFIKWTEKELIEILFKFTEDYSFAKKWGLRSKERGKEMLSVEKTRNIFNWAFNDAIRLFNSTKNPLKRE